jgi:hypothetical protein
MSHGVIIFRGSVRDLATDIAGELVETEIVELVAILIKKYNIQFVSGHFNQDEIPTEKGPITDGE